MKKIIVYLVPVFLIIISIIASLVAFSYSKKLENGYIEINSTTSTSVFEGEYFAVIGNLGDSSSYISVKSLSNNLLLTIYNYDKVITREYTIEIKQAGNSYSDEIINSYIGSDLVSFDEIEEYIFTVNLEENSQYDLNIMKTSNNVDSDQIDLLLVNIPENLLNMKNLSEGIAFSTMAFAVISGITILMFVFFKKDD